MSKRVSTRVIIAKPAKTRFTAAPRTLKAIAAPRTAFPSPSENAIAPFVFTLKPSICFSNLAASALRALADTVFELNCLACSLKALAVYLRATGSAIAPLCRAAFAP